MEEAFLCSNLVSGPQPEREQDGQSHRHPQVLPTILRDGKRCTRVLIFFLQLCYFFFFMCFIKGFVFFVQFWAFVKILHKFGHFLHIFCVLFCKLFSI